MLPNLFPHPPRVFLNLQFCCFADRAELWKGWRGLLFSSVGKTRAAPPLPCVSLPRGGLRLTREPSPGDIRAEAMQGMTVLFPSKL